jgi:hypothetical protein
MPIDDATVKRFAHLFRGRTDAAGRLQLNGRAFQDKIDVDESTYRAHLDGKKWPTCSLGVYPLTDAGLVCWGAADIDLGDEASAWRVADALEGLGVRAFVELSKGKGHHVWTFWEEWVPGYAVRRVLKRAAQEAQVACEIFPKQDNVSADSPYGNFLHLPYPGHPESAGGRYFIGRDGRALKLEEFLDRVETSAIPEWAIEREPVRLARADRLTRGVYTGDRPACVEALLSGPVPEGQRNDALARLAAHLINTEGNPQGESIAHSTGCGWGLGEREVERTIRSVKDSGRWWGCNGKRAVPVMAAACNWEACPFHRSAERERSGPTFIISEEDAPPISPPPATFSGEKIESSLLDLVAPHGFLRHYVDYCTSLSDAPPIAHLAGALTLVATMLGNRVQTLGFSGSYLRPNLWIVFIAPSGARKSSVMGKVTHFLLQTPAAGARLMSNTASKEGWFDELHRNPSRLLRADEFVGLLNHLGRKHMGGAQDFLTELFANNRVTDNTRSHGNMTIVNPAVSIIGGCTPSQLEEFAKRADFASGFLARFIFLPASKEAPAPKRIPKPRPDVEDALLKRLGWMASLTGEITFDEAINERLCTWADQFKQAERDYAGEAMGQLNRAFDFAVKLSMVMQVAETEPGAALWRDLDPDVVERAIALTEWLIRATMKMVNEDLAGSDHERNVREMLRAITRAGGTLGRRELRRAIRHLKGRDFDDVVQQLLQGGEIEQGEQESGGRPLTIYRLTSLPSTSVPLLSLQEYRTRKA